MPNHYRYRSSSKRPTRELNWKLLVSTLLLIACAAGAGWWWHQAQLRSLRAAFLERAEAAEAEGHHSTAASYLFQYLKLTKDGSEKNEMLERIAKTRERGAETPDEKRSAIEWYYRAVGAAPDRCDLHASLAQLLLDTKQFSLAEEHADEGLSIDPDNFECKRIRSLARFALMRQGKPVSVDGLTDELKELNARDPGDVEVATTLARLYRVDGAVVEDTPGETANRIIDAMVAAADRAHADSKSQNAEGIDQSQQAESDGVDQSKPYLARYLYRTEYGIDGAAEDIDTAVELNPSSPIVLITAAQEASKSGSHQRALEYYQQLADSAPKDPRAYLGIGQCWYKLGQTEKAIQAWNDGLGKSDPNDLAINVRLADVLLGLQRLDDAETPLANVKLAIEQLSSTGREHMRDWAVASNALLLAKHDVALKQYSSAIVRLHRVAATAKSQLTRADGVTLSYQAWILLGRTYGMLELWEDAAISFDRALEILPSSMETRLSAAQAWAATGRLEKAILLCEQIVHRDNAPALAWSLLAKLQLQSQLRLPTGERHWQPVENVLDAAFERYPESWELPLVQVNYLMVSNPELSSAESMRVLLNAESAHQNEPQFWTLLAQTYQAMGQISDADRAVAHLEQITGRSLDARLVKVDLLTSRRQFEDAKNVLRSLKASNENDARKLRNARIRVAVAEGDSKELSSVLLAELKDDPKNVQLLSQLAELAFQESRNADLRKWVEELKRIEGEAGTQWRYFQARDALRSTDTDIDSVKELLSDIDRLRPWWPGGTFLKGLIAEYENRSADAVSAYTSVLKLGLQTPEVYRRLLQVLYRDGRVADAEQYARLMQQRYPLTRTFSGSSFDEKGQLGQMRLSLQIAKSAVEQNPKNVDARRWLGRMLMLSGDIDEAEQELKEVTSLAPNDLHSWSALFSFYLQTNRINDAAETIESIAKSQDISDPEKNFVLAQGYQLLGQGAKAEAYYQEVIRLQPNNIDALLRYAMFLAPFDSPRAEQHARLAMKIAPENRAVRRVLAMILGNQVDPVAQNEATQLIDANAPDRAELSAADQRLKAVLLLRQSTDETDAQAEQILRTLTETPQDHKSEMGDRMLLASLLEQRGNSQAAKEQYETISGSEPVSSRHLAAYVAFLIRTKDYDSADKWLAALEKRAKNSLLTVQLRCHLHIESGNKAAAVQAMESYAAATLQTVEGEDSTKQVMLNVAQAFVTLGLSDAAEKWYQKFNQRFPGNEEYLALHWARHKKSASAVELCINSAKQDLSPETIVALAKVLILQTDEPAATDNDVAEQMIAQALQKYPRHDELLFYVANLRLKQGNVDIAIDLYRRLVDVNPKHVLAWNNLAALLAEQPGGLDEANRCADRAIDEAGYTVPTIVDTKAMVLIQRGEYDAAANLLAEIIRSPNGKDARFYFHLAIALQRSGKTEPAGKSLAFAKDLGLADKFLTKAEARYLAEINSRLAP
ncbi:MAG: tetratricopeptide repeat protein [Planctomycetales bacterium]|nr:tetratricopeptide repeat protein [Planctomycetales bacterium]